jgi:adenine-specific DNA-methyltransferase
MTTAESAESTSETANTSTNAVDMDIAAIEDPDLRRRIAAAFERLRSRAEYGLVFEKHKPESVVLHGQSIREDRYATLREKPGPTNAFRVVAIDKGKATVQPVDEHFRPDGEQTTEAVDALVPLARFGDPIYPGLVPTGEVLRAVDEEGNPTKPFHTVINGENFHALETLLYAYEGRVDCIYIDPPYNTGAKDWKYNNNYVDKDDVYRHSLWLSFMEKRLKLAQRLLNPDDSVLIVTIDEKEYLRLGLLLEQVFKTAPVTMVSSVINPAGAGRAADFSRTDEYIFYVRLGSARVRPEQRIEERRAVTWDTLRRSDLASRRGTAKGGTAQFYPFYVNLKTKAIEEIGDPLPHHVDRNKAPKRKGCVAVFPIRPDKNQTEMNWGLTPDTARERLKAGYIRVGKAKPNEPQPFVISYLTGGIINDIEAGNVDVSGRAPDGSVIAHYVKGRTVMPPTAWNRSSHDAQRYGTAILKAMIPGRRFPFPKSLYAVEDTLRHVIGDKLDALVVDFFSGSGTTAHAVMRLNRQDGGSRRTILVTNNEVAAEEQKALTDRGLQPGDAEWEALGIFEHITKPRVTAAITGREPEGEPVPGEYLFTDPFPMAEGLKENARFFNLTYLDPEAVEAKQSFTQIAHLLWLIGGAEGPVIEKEPRTGWALPQGATYGVLFRNRGRTNFADALRERTAAGDPPKHVFIVADSADEFHRSLEEVGADPAHSTRLYRSYLTNFRTNVIDLKDAL